ncbi:Uridine 5'-monophosphate synthase [Sarcoptes scabiei]|uniref:Uridine 5'-monophosphate synthase n=2 Tax=Sarcoptes scabiei TaxID=52283 RepID=A0A834RCJ9_SARSC|nr:Uridine 5'-monophosphate synthase [Sarcoptes scabiei]UXI22647.1 RNA-dependent RNA polymerase 1 [Sarcoptes scabiei]
MKIYSKSVQAIVRRIIELDMILFGQYKLKSGLISPFYIDLRSIISWPDLFEDICNEYLPLMEQCQFDLICGVPYTALTLSTFLSNRSKIPMIMKRKERKTYGTAKMFEGCYEHGQKVLIIEDVTSSGASILETAIGLRDQGLRVTDALVFIDRDMNAIENLRKHGINVHCVIKFLPLIDYLREEGHLTEAQVRECNSWILKNRSPLPMYLTNQIKLANHFPNTTYSQRAKICKNSFSKKLFQIMESKSSNLCVAADLDNCESILKLAQISGPYIVMLKLHADMINDFDEDFIKQLKAIAEQNNFLLFEDRKFADIGSLVAKQYSQGRFKIVDWAHLVTAHLISGPGMIEALKSEARKSSEPRACVLISHLSSEKNLVPPSYAEEAFSMAMNHNDFVAGFISREKVAFDPSLIHMMPGVKFDSEKGDNFGQRYTTPEMAIETMGADLIIVGRGITSKLNESIEVLNSTLQSYQTRGFEAYQKTI